MDEAVEKAMSRLYWKGTTFYLVPSDWEKTLVQLNDRPAPADSVGYPRFLYDPKDRPIYSN